MSFDFLDVQVVQIVKNERNRPYQYMHQLFLFDLYPFLFFLQLTEFLYSEKSYKKNTLLISYEIFSLFIYSVIQNYTSLITPVSLQLGIQFSLENPYLP